MTEYKAPFKAIPSNRVIRNGWEIVDQDFRWVAWCTDDTKDMVVTALNKLMEAE